MNKNVYLIGNAHLDPVWLWQWQEGFVEIKATFRSALDRMKEFPHFKFTSACSLYYLWIEKSDPEMFSEIVERVKEGRWCIVGGWFLQPDCNIPSGESFARHALVAQRYFKEKFGVTARTGYNVDSFGHNGALPKILRNSGMDSYIFMRPDKNEKTIPQSLFCWESMDGSTVRTFRVPERYCITDEKFEIFKQIEDMEDPHDMMAFYGVGNHGGGPTVQLLDHMKRDLGDNYIYSNPGEYFDATAHLELPVVKDDLQFHAKGCYSANSRVKAENRKAENEIGDTEAFSVLSGKLVGTPYPAQQINTAWQNIMFNHFHDIMGGCCIREALDDASYAHGEAINIARKYTNYALQQISWNIDTMDGKSLKPYKPASPPAAAWVAEENIGTPIVVFNPLPYPVKQMVRIRTMAKRVTDNAGNTVAIQAVRDSKTDWKNKHALAFEAEVGAYGYSVYRAYYNVEEQTYDTPLVCTENSIENENIKLTLCGECGEIVSLYDKRAGRELMSAPSRTVLMDDSKYDTWAHGISEFKTLADTVKQGTVTLIEEGPVRATLRSVMTFGNSEIIRDYSLTSDGKEIKVKTKIDFHEKHRILKFTLPVNVEDARAYAKIPFGYIERATDGGEQICGEWIAMTGKSGGLSMANTSKYSFDADKNELSLTVLRSTMYADHYGQRDEFCEFMEQGEHFFDYSLAPFDSFSASERQGEELNRPVTAIVETFHHGSLPTSYSGIEISKPNVIVTAIKRYEDGEGTILRCYETEDKDTDVKISLFGRAFDAHLSHSEVKTFLITDDNVVECDFMEWKK